MSDCQVDKYNFNRILKDAEFEIVPDKKKWISVKDRLPEIGTYCWVYIAGSDPLVCEASYLTVHTWIGLQEHSISQFINMSRFDEVNLDNVTHWMEYYTPEPPNE